VADVDIRPVDLARDAREVVEILREANPNWVLTPVSWRHHEEHVPARAERRGWVASDDDGVVGVSWSNLAAWSSESGVAYIGATVREDRRRRGIGSHLYSLAEAHALTLEARRLLCWLPETQEGVRFAETRGFTPARFAVHSVLEPATVDLSRLGGLPDGVRLAPYSELEDRLDELFEATVEAALDEPSTTPIDDVRFDEYLDEIRNPLFSWEGSYCTLVNGDVAAFAELYVDLESGRARNGFTGTRRDHRGRGCATAAKLASIRWLAERGISALWTGNDETNAPMLAINNRLGYRPALRTIEAVRQL
jgi:GNAT superfamily N-acetyltransferase